MAKFYYKVLNKDSKIEEGTISALFKGFAEKQLKKQGSTPIIIIPEKITFFGKGVSFFSGFTPSEKINFFRNLAAMNSAGVSIVESLEILSEQVKSKKLKKTILEISQSIKNGQKISKAMAEHPGYFSDFFIETVNMGEVSGRLTETFDRIADDLEKDDELRKKVKGALAYPIVVISLMIVIAIALMIFLLPNIEQLFLEIGAPIPFLTKVLIDTGHFIKEKPWLVLAVLIGLIALIFLTIRNKKGRYFFHSLALKIPVFGGLIKDYNLVLFFRSLESLVKSGVSIVYAVDIAKKTMTNDVYKKAIETAQPALLHGVPFTDALRAYPQLFPLQTQKIIEVGEKVGQMEETLKRTTRFYEREVDHKTKMIIVLVEPVLMVALGIIVGLLALSVFMPLYQLADVI